MTTTQDNFSVRPMTIDDLKLALSWAAKEGWNPGIDDAENFYSADPQGFFIGELNGEPISCISLVKYPDGFNFIGLYIVKPEWRKRGFGLRTWQAALSLVNNQQPMALDSVVEQVSNYRKFGFEPAYDHWRYRGIISGYISTDLRDVKEVNFQQLCNYDRLYFPSDRSNFLRTWIEQPHGQGYALIEEEELLGYGVIRKAQDGFKIAPLFAQSQEIAEKLFLSLATYAEGKNIYLDVPSINPQAIFLAENYQMISTFKCIRMYTAPKPALNYNNIFAITSLELG